MDASKIAKFGLVLSRFEFNKAPNPMYKPGPFTLEIEGGIRAYTAPRPQVVLVSFLHSDATALLVPWLELSKHWMRVRTSVLDVC